MNIEFVELKTYLEDKQEHINIKGYYYSLVVGVLLVLVILVTSLCKRDLYYENIMYTENNEVVLTVDYEDLGLIMNNKQIIINECTYNYQVLKTEIVSNSNLSYQIKVFINGDLFHNSNIIYQYKILLREESVLKYLFRIMKGGV